LQEIVLVGANPRGKRRHGKRRMSALQRKYFGKRRHKRRATVAAINPRPRSRRSTRRRHRIHHYRRNPRRGLGGGNMSLGKMIMPALIGAAGVYVSDAYILPMIQQTGIVPASMSSGYAGILLSGATVVGVGMLARKFAGRSTGNAIMMGGLLVASYNLISTALFGMASPQVTGRFTPRMRGLGFRNAARIASPVNPIAAISAQPVIAQRAGRYTRMR
jgi:hypothetical protein